jgi:hypothetical protein
MTQQFIDLQKFIEEQYIPYIYNELLESNEQVIKDEWFDEISFFEFIHSGDVNFFEEWCKTPNSIIQAETILLFFKEVQDFHEQMNYGRYTKYKVKDIVNYWAYIVGVKKWKKLNIKEEKINDNQHSNETEDTCPICLRDYDRNTLLKDGIQNSDCISDCNHWACVECWEQIYYQHNDIDTCPICRSDITDWLQSHYPLDEESDSEEEDINI